MQKFKNIRLLGRYKNTDTSKSYNIYKCTKVGYGTDCYFYFYRNKKQFISDREFYGGTYIKIN